MKKISLNIILVLLSQVFNACGQDNFDKKLNVLYKKTVPLINNKTFNSKMDSSNVLILDTRTKREFKVSKIQGAHLVEYDEFSIKDFENVPKDKEIVVYCSVGYRSERVGEALLAAGFKNVHNLYGGIFNWKNEKFPVFNEQGQLTDSVHAYNRIWGIWLNDKNAVKVYE